MIRAAIETKAMRPGRPPGGRRGIGLGVEIQISIQGWS
jgi:hypothetical protein